MNHLAPAATQSLKNILKGDWLMASSLPAVLEILQLVKKRDLFLADTHILELEQECIESAATDRGAVQQQEDAISPSMKDGGRRKAKDVELLYEELQKELWSVVRESLRSPTAGPNLGLVVQVSPRILDSSKSVVASKTFQSVKS